MLYVQVHLDKHTIPIHETLVTINIDTHSIILAFLYLHFTWVLLYTCIMSHLLSAQVNEETSLECHACTQW